MCASVYVFTHTHTSPGGKLAVKKNLLCTKRLKQMTQEVYSSHISWVILWLGIKI